MEKTLNQTVKSFSAARSNIEENRVVAGDFMNSGQLDKHLSTAIRSLNQIGGPGLPRTLGSPQAQVDEAYVNAQKMGTWQMPQKTVLFEACCINQPLNSFLRDKYSIGTYYFLK